MKELIERLRLYAGQGIQTGTARITQRGAANLLEQQAAEIERLNDRWTEWKDSLNSVMEQRNALQAKLSAMEKQEPVMIYHGGCTIDCGEHGHHNMEMLKLIPAGTKLYANAAPQAPAPRGWRRGRYITKNGTGEAQG